MLQKYEVCMCASVCLYTQVNALELSPAGTLLATGTKEGILTVWDVSSPLPLHQLTCHSGNIHQVAFSPGERPPHLCLNRKRWKWVRPVLILLCVCVFRQSTHSECWRGLVFGRHRCTDRDAHFNCTRRRRTEVRWAHGRTCRSVNTRVFNCLYSRQVFSVGWQHCVDRRTVRNPQCVEPSEQ